MKINWTQITDPDTLEDIKTASKNQKQVIFKHSTTCPISATALGRLERSWKTEEMEEVKVYFLDLLRYRDISNQIAEMYHVKHESPQILVLDNEKVIYNESHLDINYEDLKSNL